jgi:signal transduction histidine kinase/ligand-binding sensor domain-containing protein
MFSRHFTATLLLAFVGCFVPEYCHSAQFEGAPVNSYTTRRFTTENGLPQNTVRFLTQSRDGYLWIGTSDGAARYDGLKFTVYRREIQVSEGSETLVWDIQEDGDGKIWVRTQAGLACFNHGRWQTFRSDNDNLKGLILMSCATRSSGIWLAMPDGVKRFTGNAIARVYTKEDGLWNDTPFLAGEDLNGFLWLGGIQSQNEPHWQRLDPRTGKIIEIQSVFGPIGKAPDLLFPSPSGALWSCGQGELIKRFAGRVTRYALPRNSATNPITHLTEDSFGAVWFICEAIPRVFRIGPDGSSELSIPEMPSRDLRCVLAGRDGVVWVGTGDQGLIEVKPRPFSSILTTNTIGEKIEVFSICAGDKGRIWIGTSDGLYRYYNGVLARFTNAVPKENGWLENSVRSVLEDHTGKVWFGIQEQGLKTLQGDEFAQVTAAACGLNNSWTATTLLEDRKGNLWIGSELGLIRRAPDGNFSLISTNPVLKNQRINGVQEASNGAIWFGTSGAGVYEVTDKKVRQFTKRDGLSSDDATPLRIETNGAVWIGTPNALNRLMNGKVSTISSQKGLFENELYSLCADKRGFYWASGNRGVCRLSKAELDAVADGLTNRLNCLSFGEADGLPSTECNGESQPNMTCTPEGRLWFSTTRGCATIDSTGVVSSEAPAPVVIEEVLVDDELVFKDGALTVASSETKPHFQPGRGGVLEIRYTATSFLNPGKISFEHRLNGYNEAWRNAGGQRVALYTNIKPGDYTFEVRARNQQGALSPKLASFSFSLAPHFWQTWPFYAVVVVAVVGAAAGLQGYRLRWQRRLLKLEEQRALANERARIARDLHDDLGTALTGLALELDVVGREAGNTPQVAQRLSQTAKRTRGLAERMREVVWSVNPRCDTVSSLLDFLEEQAEQFLRASGTKVRFDFPEDIPNKPLEARARHHLALTVREVLNNVVRHAKATEVLLNVALGEGVLNIQIQDNGRGFQVVEQSGHGLANLRLRMEEVGGSFKCHSAPGAGTTITLCLPLSRSCLGRTSKP